MIKLIYIEGEYFTFKDGELVPIPKDKIQVNINNAHTIIAFNVYKKKWVYDKNEWIGPEKEPLPDVLKDKKVQEVSVMSKDNIPKILKYV